LRKKREIKRPRRLKRGDEGKQVKKHERPRIIVGPSTTKRFGGGAVGQRTAPTKQKHTSTFTGGEKSLKGEGGP